MRCAVQFGRVLQRIQAVAFEPRIYAMRACLAVNCVFQRSLLRAVQKIISVSGRAIYAGSSVLSGCIFAFRECWDCV